MVFSMPSMEVMQALTDLQTAVTDPNATPVQIREKESAVRSARGKARADLADAQRDLVQLLTASQEAVLVGLGILD